MGITGAGCHGPGESGVLPPNNVFHLETLHRVIDVCSQQCYPCVLHPQSSWIRSPACPPVTPLSDHLTWTPRCFTRTNYPSLAKTSTCKVRQSLVVIHSHQDQDSPGFCSCQCSQITCPLSPCHTIIYLIISCLDKISETHNTEMYVS